MPPDPADVAAYGRDLTALRDTLAERSGPPSAEHLRYGADPVGCDPEADAAAWATAQLSARITWPDSVAAALGAMADAPCLDTARALDALLVAACTPAKTWRNKNPQADLMALHGARERLTWSLALMGDEDAALRAARTCARILDPRYGPSMSDALQGQVLISLLEMLDRANGSGGYDVPRLALRAMSWATLGSYGRIHAVHVASQDAQLDDDAPAGPGLVVVPSLDHLPGSKTSGSTKGSVSHSPRGEWQPLSGKRIPLAQAPDLGAAGAALRQEFPDAWSIVEPILLDSLGAPAARIRPTLIVGEPGSGKTRLARRLGEVLGLPVTMYVAAGVADGAFGGTSRQWGTGRACVPLQAVKRDGFANPLVILDEIEKAGTGDHNGRLSDTLLGLLERESACRFFDPYLETAVDLSAVSYVATANSLNGVPGPLLSRMRILRMPRPSRASIPGLAARMAAEVRAERGLDATWMPDLDGDELALVLRGWEGRSLRTLRRLVETVLSAREALAPRH